MNSGPKNQEAPMRSVHEVLNEREKIAKAFPTSDGQVIVFFGEGYSPHSLCDEGLLETENCMAQMRVSIHNLVTAEDVLADMKVHNVNGKESPMAEILTPEWEQVTTIWRLRVDSFSITILNNHHDDPGKGVMHAFMFKIDTLVLKADSLEKAKKEAIEIVKVAIEKYTADLKEIGLLLEETQPL